MGSLSLWRHCGAWSSKFLPIRFFRPTLIRWILTIVYLTSVLVNIPQFGLILTAPLMNILPCPGWGAVQTYSGVCKSSRRWLGNCAWPVLWNGYYWTHTSEKVQLRDSLIFSAFASHILLRISLFHFSSVKHVYGYEVVAQAIADAGVNAKLNGIHNATFIQGDLNKIDENFGNNFPKPDIVISGNIKPASNMCTVHCVHLMLAS